MSNMVRCYIICEGQSEEEFVNISLYPYFQASGIYLTPLMICTSKRQKGGGLNYDRVLKFVSETLKKDKGAFVTTMFDYYGLEGRFLDDVNYENDVYNYIENIQKSFDEKIKETYNTDRFFSYIQLHEFESLLFSDITKITEADAEWNQASIKDLEKIIHEIQNPELINNARETSPSHRLEKILSSPKYRKVLHGNIIAQKIGIENIRLRCRHFNDWCHKISSLNR